MLNTIVVALDGSAHGDRAFEFAVDLARRFDAELHLVHVVTRHEIPDDLRRMAEVEHLVPSPAEAREKAAGDREEFGAVLRNVERFDQGDRILEKLGEKVLETGEAEARGKGIEAPVTALLRGDPADEIVRYVERVGADTVVSGSRGLGRLRGLVLGSVSHKLAQHAPCASIVVR